MANNELLNMIEALNEWEALAEEAKAEAEALRDALKQEMLERDTEELVVGQHIITCPIGQLTIASSGSSKRWVALRCAFMICVINTRLSLSKTGMI